ncbi:MAG: sulfurtransferase TusA family protein [Nitrososphaeria archaeon]|nr:sulfurtransferase TusA family protein [Nitrososphaeria archaeon]
MDVKRLPNGEYLLDLKGTVCPYPVLYTKMTLEKLKAGEILQVVIDNPPSLETVPASVKASGNEVLEIREIEPAVWIIRIRRR